MPLKTRCGIVALGCSAFLLVRIASAHDVVKKCPGADVRTISVSVQMERETRPDAAPEGIELAPEDSPGTATKAITAIALGPVLGSMDSSDVKTDLACTPNGIALTVTIVRNAEYNGSVLANINWRPRIEISIVPRQPEVILETIWRMKLTTGNELDRARTPPYPEKKYPIRVTKSIRRP